VEEAKVLGASRVKAGDVLVALASNGLHTNGYSLARRIVSERLQLGPHDAFPDANGASVADVLLQVHRSYLAALRPVLDRIHAMAHITGGGLPGNLNRALPVTLDADIDTTTWTVPSAFRVLQEAGAVETPEMFRAFNMGVGMVVITAPEDARDVRTRALACGFDAWELGRVVAGSGQVRFNGEVF
jgi:phosphoribosylformylglycinamidine cyclo-ligase